MTYKSLDVVVLDRDLADRGLSRGDLGTVVTVVPPHALEVEFVEATGRTTALLTLEESDVRPIRAGDVLAVRRLDRPA